MLKRKKKHLLRHSSDPVTTSTKLLTCPEWIDPVSMSSVTKLPKHQMLINIILTLVSPLLIEHTTRWTSLFGRESAQLSAGGKPKQTEMFGCLTVWRLDCMPTFYSFSLVFPLIAFMGSHRCTPRQSESLVWCRTFVSFFYFLFRFPVQHLHRSYSNFWLYCTNFQSNNIPEKYYLILSSYFFLFYLT